MRRIRTIFEEERGGQHTTHSMNFEGVVFVQLLDGTTLRNLMLLLRILARAGHCDALYRVRGGSVFS
jgi:hypothetical protein